MRAFIAVLPPPETVEEVQAFLEPRRDALEVRGDRSWRWTRAEHQHLTLAFLPELEEWREEALVEAGQEWAARHTPVQLTLAGAGAFPNPGAARVLWAGVEGEHEALADWAKGLRALASRAGARVDGTRFHPHLTLARSTGRPRPAGHLLQALDTLRASPFTAGEVALVASHLGEGPRGTPRYVVRHRWALGAG